MKSIWSAVGIAIGAFCLLGIGLFGLASSARNKVAQDARAFVKKTAPKFLASDMGAEFLSFAAPELRSKTPPESADRMFTLIRKRLGRYQGLTKVTLGTNTVSNVGGSERIFVDFKLQVDYDKGQAEFDAVVVRSGEKWEYGKLNLTTKLSE